MPPLFRRLVALLKSLKSFDPPWDPSEDPYAAVRQPRRPGPTGRSSAVALEEPRPPRRVHAVGAAASRRQYTDPDEG